MGSDRYRCPDCVHLKEDTEVPGVCYCELSYCCFEEVEE